jgi:hypothetical protein
VTDLAAIDRLRGIAARLIEGEDADAAWFAASLAEYESGAPAERTLDDALAKARPDLERSAEWTRSRSATRSSL